MITSIVTKRVPALASLTALAALLVTTATMPARADGSGSGSGPEPRAPVSAPLWPGLLQHNDPFPERHLTLDLPPSLVGVQSANAPKFSLEFGYGDASPLHLDSASKLPDNLGGHSDLRAVRAGVTFGF